MNAAGSPSEAVGGAGDKGGHEEGSGQGNINSGYGGAGIPGDGGFKGGDGVVMLRYLTAHHVPDVISTFTVNSNCIGGYVYFDDIVVGTIPANGKFIHEIINDPVDTHAVKITGGVPSSTSWDSDYISGLPAGTVNFYPQGGPGVWDFVSRYETGTTTYSAPSNTTINKNSSITMNYTSSTSYRDQGSAPCYVSGNNMSWMQSAIHNSSSPFKLWLSASANNTGSRRIGRIDIHQTSGQGYASFVCGQDSQ